MANKIRIVDMGKGMKVYQKGGYSGYVDATFGNGRKYGYHANLAKGTSNINSSVLGQSSFKTKAAAINAVKRWLNSK